MLFKEFSEYLEKIENIASRNEMTEILAEFIGKLDNTEIEHAMYLLIGRLAPRFIPLEFNFSSKLLLKALDGLNFSFGNIDEGIDVKKLYAELGDVGAVVEKFVIDKKYKAIEHSIVDIFNKLHEIAIIEGTGSQGIKIEKFQNLIKTTSPVESKYLSRMIIGKLRLGLSDKTILDALSWFKTGDKSIRKMLDRAYGVRADIGKVAKIIIENKIENLDEVLNKLKIEPGTPVASKLVEREKTMEKVWERMGECIVQPKLDGLRAQIHFGPTSKNKSSSLCHSGRDPESELRGEEIPDQVRDDKNVYESSEVRIFSRNMENMTSMFPDLVKAVENLGVESIVLDSEAIGYDYKNEKYLPFQETIQRKRKHGVDEKAGEVPIKALVFDLLFLNGKDLSREPVERRMQLLEEIVNNQKQNDRNQIELLDTQVMKSADSMEQYFEDRVGEGLEGIIVKKLGTFYDPGTRNYDWIKMKASLKKGMVDTIDGVVLGYYHGKGVRSKNGIGAILIGIFDEKSGEYKSVAKVGTGITDELFVTMKKDLMGITTKLKPGNYDIQSNIEPDVFVVPEIVVEVEADEVTRSKMHTAAKDKDGRGLSMRFPRLKVWNRQDKDVSQATSVGELEKMGAS